MTQPRNDEQSAGLVRTFKPLHHALKNIQHLTGFRIDSRHLHLNYEG